LHKYLKRSDNNHPDDNIEAKIININEILKYFTLTSYNILSIKTCEITYFSSCETDEWILILLIPFWLTLWIVNCGFSNIILINMLEKKSKYLIKKLFNKIIYTFNFIYKYIFPCKMIIWK
jgi:hypothetical protein